jgi:uncharacterized repeat protein (TIGR01451 family)
MVGDQRLRCAARLVRLAGLAVAWVLCIPRGEAAAQPPTAEPPLAGGPLRPPGPPGPPGVAAPPAGREPADPPVPMVSLRVRVPARAEPGKELEYRLLVENCSKAAAHHVRVRDRLPRGARLVRANPEPASRTGDLTWDFGTLAPCARKEIVVVIVPEVGAEIENNAYVQFEHGETVRTLVHRPDLRLRVLVPPRVPLHDPIAFRLQVTNVGLADAVDVLLKEQLPAELKFLTATPSTAGDNPLTWKLGTLPPGQSRSVEFSAASLSPGTFADRAEVTAAGGLRQEASAYVQVGERLLVVKSGPERRLVRREATYRITAINAGAEPLANVQVVNVLPRREEARREPPSADSSSFPEAAPAARQNTTTPQDIVFVAASDGGKREGDSIRWSLGTLKPGERRTVRMTIRAVVPGKARNVTTVTADGGLSAWNALWTQFEEAAGPVVEIDKGDDLFEVGRPATCRFRVVNAGAAPAAGVGLTVRVPDDWRLLRAGGRSAGRQGAGFVRFDPLPSLAAGEEAEYTVEVQASKPGPAPLRAELTTAPGTAPLLWEEVLTAENGKAQR